MPRCWNGSSRGCMAIFIQYFLKSNQLYCADVCCGLRDEVFTQRPFVQGVKLVKWLSGFDIPRFPDSLIPRFPNSPIPCFSDSITGLTANTLSELNAKTCENKKNPLNRVMEFCIFDPCSFKCITNIFWYKANRTFR